MKNYIKQYTSSTCIISFIMIFHSLYSQEAGEDRAICKDKNCKVKIGPKTALSDCFYWEEEEGLTKDQIHELNPEVNPTTETEYTLHIIGTDFNTHKKDKVKVKVVEPKVEYEEISTQKYGFDNFGPNADAPWKSIKSGNETDVVKTKISPDDGYDAVYFHSANEGIFTVTPDHATSKDQALTITGVSSGVSAVEANCCEPTGDNISKLNIAVYNGEPEPITVAMLKVAEGNDDIQVMTYGTSGNSGDICISAGPNGKIDSKPEKGNEISADKLSVIISQNSDPDDNKCNTRANSTDIIPAYNLSANSNSIIDNVNKVFDQVCWSYTITTLTDVCRVGYDHDWDKMLLTVPGGSGAMSDEMQTIHDSCIAKFPGYKYYVFFVGKGSDPLTVGEAGNYSDYAFVITELHPGTTADVSQIVAHELGHATFALSDLSQTDSQSDPENLMGFPSTAQRWRLRKNQWDQMTGGR